MIFLPWGLFLRCNRIIGRCAVVDAHDQQVTNRYLIHYPAHPARTDDPHYRDFEAYRRATKGSARCAVAVEIGDAGDCDTVAPLELHHAHVEFIMPAHLTTRRRSSSAG